MVAFVNPGQGVSREDVITAYEMFLCRSPDESAINWHLQFPDRKSLADHMLGAPEFKLVRKVASVSAPAPDIGPHQIYKGYNPRELAVLEQFQVYTGGGTPGFFTNFLGVKVRTAFTAGLIPFDGAFQGYPMPIGGLQGETAEFIGTLRSVLDARDRFAILECGAGYGPWMAITTAAARQRGIQEVHLHGIEGDAGHVEFISQHLSDNGIDLSTCDIIHGAVGAEAGVAHWAVVDNPDRVYGGRPMGDGAVDYLGVEQTRLVKIDVYSIVDLLMKEPEWDLVHIDIQGGEAEVCRAGIRTMNERVRRVVLGTHSRALDGELMSIFSEAKWSLENEKPTIFQWREGAETLESLTRVDGIQVWRNPRLIGAPAI